MGLWRPAVWRRGWICRPRSAPFILRGVALLGIDSVMCPVAKRREAWRRLSTDLDRTKLGAMTTHVAFADVLDTARAILDGTVRGRVVVDIG